MPANRDAGEHTMTEEARSRLPTMMQVRVAR